MAIDGLIGGRHAAMVSAQIALVGGLVMTVGGLLGLRSWRRVDAATRRLSERLGWPTDDGPQFRYLFAAVLVIGVGWLVAAAVNW